MAEAFTLHKMRPSERCDECPTRKWYEVDGNRFCKNGHQLEGYAPHEAGEDEYNSTGRVTRVKKEKRKREGLKLEGKEGRRLYLQALQYVLRRQTEWVRDVGLKLDDDLRRMEYERVVRELWAALYATPGVMDEEEAAEAAGSGTEGDVVASASELEDSDADSGRRRNGWLEKRGSKLPSHTHALALCYLACVILRYPVTTADFHGWAQRGDLDYLAAIHSLPVNVQNRLPAMYHRALQVRDHIKPGKLLSTAQELVVALSLQYEGLRFPALNHTPVLLHYILSLTLPIDVFLMVKCLIGVLEATFDFPNGDSKRIRAMDNPEVLLITLVVVATKLLYPMDGNDRPPASEDDPHVKQIDWAEWQKMRAKASNKPATETLEKGTEHRITSNDALIMEKNKMDDFMDWFDKMWVGSTDVEAGAPAAIQRAFESGENHNAKTSRHEANASTTADVTTATTNTLKRQYQRLNETMRVLEPQPDPQPVKGNTRKRPDRDFCPTWRTEEDLPATAKALYREAADLAAIPLKSLIVAGLQVERRLEIWSAQREKQKRRTGEVAEDAKGKGKAVM
ncbi:hypothetical protein BKA67DRAFT_529141 [Truncatella angustata]|uniref:RRN7-type domain-containing protein n=1 Tax=Truncatella angustata TaxID=152316 RepID=A0A9P9A0Y5_9PEZI|nr:uncharacterized protein BKA67DRAFT_529141 [Truncatella angustata]KAH6658951.1 hypothetical protein BKA67DRAFT_529141 [Truncatella angustata]